MLRCLTVTTTILEFAVNGYCLVLGNVVENKQMLFFGFYMTGVMLVGDHLIHISLVTKKSPLYFQLFSPKNLHNVPTALLYPRRL